MTRGRPPQVHHPETSERGQVEDARKFPRERASEQVSESPHKADHIERTDKQKDMGLNDNIGTRRQWSMPLKFSEKMCSNLQCLAQSVNQSA